MNSIEHYWDELTAIYPKYGHIPKPAKSYLIVKKKDGSGKLNIIAEWKRHLGAVIESTKYCDQYVKDLVKDWNNQLTTFWIIAETQQQTA